MQYSPAWAFLGALVVVFIVYDFYVTTLTLHGGGPLSKRLARGIWACFLRVHKAQGSPAALSTAGPIILLFMIITWFGLSWLGWFLVFCGAEDSVVNATTLLPASVGDRIYYAGYTLTTIGYGDFRAPHGMGQIASVVSGFNGLFLVTLAITYSMPVISATADRRQLAILINAFGQSLPELIDRGRGDGSFRFMASQLQQFAGKIASVSQKHLAYPVIRYFPETHPRKSLPLNLARLDEAIAVVLFAFPDLPNEVRAQLTSTQQVIEASFTRIDLHPRRTPTDPREEPNFEQISALRDSDKTTEAISEMLASRPQRHLLVDYVQKHGWRWSDVHAPTES